MNKKDTSRTGRIMPSDQIGVMLTMKNSGELL